MARATAWPWESTATASSWPWDSAKRSSNKSHSLAALRRWMKGKETPLAIAACVLTATIAWLLQRRLGGDGNGDATRRREMARAARLKHFDDRKPVPRHRSPPPAAASSSDAFHDPSRYRPASDENDRLLQVHGESLMVRDGGYQWQPASCILDTGNAAMTVIDSDYAKRHKILVSDGGGVFGRPEEYTTLRGINPGAETRAPVVTACLSLRGREFTIKCAVSPMPSNDVLIGLDVLRELFSEGYVVAR